MQLRKCFLNLTNSENIDPRTGAYTVLKNMWQPSQRHPTPHVKTKPKQEPTSFTARLPHKLIISKVQWWWCASQNYFSVAHPLRRAVMMHSWQNLCRHWRRRERERAGKRENTFSDRKIPLIGLFTTYIHDMYMYSLNTHKTWQTKFTHMRQIAVTLSMPSHGSLTMHTHTDLHVKVQVQMRLLLYVCPWVCCTCRISNKRTALNASKQAICNRNL